MKKLIKLSVAAALLVAPTHAYAMPDEVPSFWTTLMWRTWAKVADHRPCNGSIARTCDGQF